MKAQASVELLVILSVLLIVFSTVSFVAQEQYQESQMNLDAVKAKNALRTMLSAASDVYSQGEGATSRVYVDIPGRIESAEVGQRFLKYRMDLAGRIQDVMEPSDMCLTGYIPGEAGGQWVQVESRGGCVMFGESLIKVSAGRLNYRLYAGDTQEQTIRFTNYDTKQANLSLTVTGTDMLVLSAENITVEPGETLSVVVAAKPPEDTAKGSYYGHIEVGGAQSSTVDASILILGQAQLTTYPDTWTAYTMAGESKSQDIVVCNRGDTLLTNIKLTSSGVVASWIAFGGPATIDSLQPAECQTKQAVVTPPEGTAVGTYTGSVLAEADGGASDSTFVEVTVSLSGGNMSELVIMPRQWNVTMWRLQTANNTYTVCNLGGSVFTDVSLETAGSADWITFDPGKSIGVIGPGKCFNDAASLTVPDGTAHGAYPGTVSAKAGNLSAVAYVNVDVYQVLVFSIFNETRCCGPVEGVFNVNSKQRCIGG